MPEPFALRIELDQQQVKRLRATIDGGVITALVQAGGVELQKFLSVAPPKKAGAFSSMATPGQRRAYWAKVRSGEAKHGAGGYIRSGKTAKAWVIIPIGFGRVKLLNQNVSSAPWVYGKPTLQQPFHAASGWPRVDTVLNDAKLQARLQAAVDRELAKMMRRL